MQFRPYSAVVFDLYDTLVPGGGRETRDAASAAMAADLGVDPRAFADLIRTSFDQRARGQLGDLTETIATLATRLGGAPGRSAMEAAARRRLELHRRLLRPAGGTIRVLSRLRADGYRIGVLSDCSAETPDLWSETTLAGLTDAAVFSCAQGTRKPDPILFRLIADALGVDPTRCLYVGDGASDELNGAAAAGMTAVQLRVAHADPRDAADHQALYGGRPWRGVVVDDLAAVSDVLATAAAER